MYVSKAPSGPAIQRGIWPPHWPAMFYLKALSTPSSTMHALDIDAIHKTLDCGTTSDLYRYRAGLVMCCTALIHFCSSLLQHRELAPWRSMKWGPGGKTH